MRRNEGTITQCVYIQSKAALKCKAAIANVLIMIMYLMTRERVARGDEGKENYQPNLISLLSFIVSFSSLLS